MFRLTVSGLKTSSLSITRTIPRTTLNGLPTIGLRQFKTSNTNKFDIPFLKQIPQPPGNIVGTVNDAAPVPQSNWFHGSYHWTYERILCIGLVPLTILPIATGSIVPSIDALLGSTILLHTYLGFESCIVDYIPKRTYGKWHNRAKYLLQFGTAVSFYGIYAMETEDDGLVGFVTKSWTA